MLGEVAGCSPYFLVTNFPATSLDTSFTVGGSFSKRSCDPLRSIRGIKKEEFNHEKPSSLFGPNRPARDRLFCPEFQANRGHRDRFGRRLRQQFHRFTASLCEQLGKPYSTDDSKNFELHFAIRGCVFGDRSLHLYPS